MDDKLLIDEITRSYFLSKKAIERQKLGLALLNDSTLDSHKYLIDKINFIISSLSDKDKFILVNEIIQGKKGDWYVGFMSTPTYYRHRKTAYNDFLNCMNI